MSELTQQELLDAIDKFQNNNFVHSLTCDCGALLKAEVINNKVVLLCPNCKRKQELTESLKSIIIWGKDYKIII